METKHTPGPWTAIAGLGRWNVTTSGTPRTLNVCAVNTDRVEQEANAHLIAAAPDLLAALQIVSQRKMANFTMDEWGQIEAAIAKAGGMTNVSI